MAAQIPIKGDEAANKAALDKVRADKLREVQAGHDGTWVAHPALVAVAQEIFDQYMPAPNQLGKLREDVQVSREQLLAAPGGSISRADFDYAELAHHGGLQKVWAVLGKELDGLMAEMNE